MAVGACALQVAGARKEQCQNITYETNDPPTSDMGVEPIATWKSIQVRKVGTCKKNLTNFCTAKLELEARALDAELPAWRIVVMAVEMALTQANRRDIVGRRCSGSL